MGEVRQHAGGVAEREAQEAKERGGDVVADARGPPQRKRAPLQGLPLPSNDSLVRVEPAELLVDGGTAAPPRRRLRPRGRRPRLGPPPSRPCFSSESLEE